ncbi:MAG: D-alanine--D-alanine ligase [Chloroflexi bacterium]|nr:D-alanine--D-alanine ligase [Chloroflexota bacterium]
MAKLRVGVLFGGQSVEHEVSLLSAQSVLAALDPSRYEVVPLGITHEGKWLAPAAATRLLGAGASSPGQEPAPNGALRQAQDGALRQAQDGAQADVTALVLAERALADLPKLDVIFPVLHGTFGEDGTVQGLLELADVPYVGAGVLGSAVGLDKDVMKRVFREAGLPVVRFLTILRKDWERRAQAIQADVEGALGYPCFVKPANGGSSVGIAKVHGPEDLPQAMEAATALDRKVLVEEAIQGRELECSVLGNDDPEASAVGEVIPAREFYDYQAKYFDERTRLVVPAPIPRTVADLVRQLAVRAFRAIDCAGMARVDFFLRASDGTLFVNEINTIPGFTPMSMYPKMWEAAGLSYSALLDRLIQLALERHQEKRQNRYNYAALRQQAG